MNYQWLYKKSRLFLILSVLSLGFVWLSNTLYLEYRHYRSNQNLITKRDVLLNVAMKASSIVATNNPSPIFYNTLKRIIVRAPNQSISGYIYSNNVLKIRLANSVNLFDISRLFNYLPYSKVKNDYEIRI